MSKNIEPYGKRQNIVTRAAKSIHVPSLAVGAVTAYALVAGSLFWKVAVIAAISYMVFSMVRGSRKPK